MKGLKAILELLKNILNEGDIHYIGGAEPLPPPLDKEEEAVLLKRLDLGDEDAKRELIERNLRLVVYIARRFDNTGIGTEDLVSIGSIGLIKAISTFNTGKNIKLATYASRCIENEILMYLRKSSNQRSEISLDEPLNTDWDGNELLLSELLGTDDDIVNRGIESEAEKKILNDAVTRLGARERTIMNLVAASSLTIVSISCPRRMTLMVSAQALTSLSLCVMMITVCPIRLRSWIFAISSSTSCGIKTAVGSSRIKTLTWR